MTDLKKEYDAWLDKYVGNLLAFSVEDTEVEYSVDIDGLQTDIDDGMYEVELFDGSKSYKAKNRICIVDGMIALETLTPVIEEHLEADRHHTTFEGVRLVNGLLKLGMSS